MKKINIAIRDLENPSLSSPSTAEIRARLNLVKEDLERLSFAVEADADLQESSAPFENGPHVSKSSAAILVKRCQKSAPDEIPTNARPGSGADTGYSPAATGNRPSLVFNLNGHGTDMKMLAPKDLSDILGLSRSTVYRLAGKGVLKSHRIGRRIRFDLEEVMNSLANRAS